MAVASSIVSKDYNALFRRRILINTQYWQAYVTDRLTGTHALENERDPIIRAISFALDLEAAWPHVYDLIVKFSPYMERRGHWESWNQVLNRALKTGQQLEDTTRVTTLSALLARLLQRRSRTRQAIEQYRRTIRLARRTGNRFEEARACSNLGYLYVEQGHWQRSEVLCCHALDIFEQIDNSHGRAHTENHLGRLYTLQGRWHKAQGHLERACAIWQATGDEQGLLSGLINLGELHIKMKQPGEALKFLEKALYQAKISGAEPEIGNIYNNLGFAYKLQDELSKAETYTREAETIFRKFFNSYGLANVLENLGTIYIEQQKWPQAYWHLEKALEAWRVLNSKRGEIQTMVYLVQCELATGDQQNAINRLEEAEYGLSQYPQVGGFNQLTSQLNRIRRSLLDQATTKS